MASDWPEGPVELAELFHWPDFNANHLLQTHPKHEQFRSNFTAISQFDVEITESYAGMGTGGFTMHWQHGALKRV